VFQRTLLRLRLIADRARARQDAGPRVGLRRLFDERAARRPAEELRVVAVDDRADEVRPPGAVGAVAVRRIAARPTRRVDHPRRLLARRGEARDGLRVRRRIAGAGRDLPGVLRQVALLLALEALHDELGEGLRRDVLALRFGGGEARVEAVGEAGVEVD